MNIFILLFYVSFLFYCSFVLYLFFDNYRSSLNISYALLVVSFILWSLGDTFIQTSTSVESVIFWEKISSLGWCSYPIFLLLFVLVLTNRKSFIKKNFFIFIIMCFISLLLIYKQFKEGLLVNNKNYFFGWHYEWSTSIWTYLYFLYSSIVVFISLFLCRQFVNKIDDINKKKFFKIIFWCILFGFVVGFMTNILLPILKIYVIPPIASASLVIFVGYIIYSINNKGEFL